MNISAEEKNRYLREAEVVLAREGFLTDRTHAGMAITSLWWTCGTRHVRMATIS